MVQTQQEADKTTRRESGLKRHQSHEENHLLGTRLFTFRKTLDEHAAESAAAAGVCLFGQDTRSAHSLNTASTCLTSTHLDWAEQGTAAQKYTSTVTYGQNARI